MRIKPRHVSQGTTFSFFLKSGETDFEAFLADLDETNGYEITVNGEVFSDGLKDFCKIDEDDNTMSVSLTFSDEDDAAHFKLKHF